MKEEPVLNDKSAVERTIEQIELAIQFLQWESSPEAITKLKTAFENVKKVLRENDTESSGSKNL